MMNGHFLPRKSKFVFLNNSMNSIFPASDVFRHQLKLTVPAAPEETLLGAGLPPYLFKTLGPVQLWYQNPVRCSSL